MQKTMEQKKSDKLSILRDRLSKIGIDIEVVANFPWIYLTKINGIIVQERFEADHGFTIGFYYNTFEFTDLKEIFSLIRKYKNK